LFFLEKKQSEEAEQKGEYTLLYCVQY